MMMMMMMMMMMGMWWVSMRSNSREGLVWAGILGHGKCGNGKSELQAMHWRLATEAMG